ncbi:hypothetical protein BC2903_08230 [Bacillus cereus]|nr:hypothetical protein BC2903_08230 [Bacillus cereus]GIX56752.1 hypothetical protein BPADB04_17820 [Bacillus paranthracis]
MSKNKMYSRETLYVRYKMYACEKMDICYEMYSCTRSKMDVRYESDA